MKKYERRLEFWQCLRCDYLWPKRPGPRPIICPGCTNKLWATEKRRAPGAGRKKKVVEVVEDVGATVPVTACAIPQETVVSVVSDGEKNA